MDGIGCLQLDPAGGCRFPKKLQQEQAQLGNDHIIGEGIHQFMLPEHLPKQLNRLPGGFKLPVQQGCQIAAIQIKGQCHIPGCYIHIGILHMPLVGTVENHISLIQQQILSIRNRVQASLIHIGQLQHRVGLTGEQEALLLLMIEEGIQSLHPEPVIDPKAVGGTFAHQLRVIPGRYVGRSVTHKRHQAEQDPAFDANRLIQIKMQVGKTVVGYAQHTISGAAVDPGIRRSPEHIDFPVGQYPQMAFVCIFYTLCPFRRNGAKALKGHLIQITDHSPLPRVNR